MTRNQGSTTHLQMLLDDANQGDRAAVDALIEKAERRLRQLASRMLGRYPRLRRWEETDDVFQNASLRLYRSLRDVQPESLRQFFGLAATQVRWTLIDLVRHHFGPQGQAANHHSEQDLQPIAEPAERQDSNPASLEEWTLFHECVDTLAEDEREAFSIVWYGGMSQREAAEVLGISERTMIRRMNRARMNIQVAMTGINLQSDAEE